MNCERLSDRMPGVLAGRDHWSREDEEHLVVCADCRSEWQLLVRGSALGAELPGLDVSRISAEVQRRLALAKRADRNRRRGWLGLGLAAAAALVLVIARPRSTGEAPASPIAEQALVLPVIELDSLSAAELQAVLETMEPPLGTNSTLDAPSLQDLDDHQLERVLRSLEG